MARIELRDLAHSYSPKPRGESDYALKSLQMTWQSGRAYALLGPSGCGKTTLLNIISGLLSPMRGRILFDGADVTALPPERRNIAQVFQFPVVYDTMTVYQNLAFPLKNRGVAPSAIDAKVRLIAEHLGLNPGDKARTLGADAKQKVSLGRGLVRDNVAAILFDEPLTVIDPQLKWRLRGVLKALHREFDFTMIYVTHDQTEALTFADEVAVMHDGNVMQVGSPGDLFERPAHVFVGQFIGSPGMNLLDCEIRGGEVIVGGDKLPLARRFSAPPTGRLQLGIRPEFIRLHPANGAAPPPHSAPVKIRAVEDGGHRLIARAALFNHNTTVAVIAPPESGFRPGDDAFAVFDPMRARLYADGKANDD
jgi:glycerol transport system ATP-binding protein